MERIFLCLVDHNNASAGRSLRRYQSQLTKAYSGTNQGHIDTDNRSIREYCEFGSKVATSVLTDLVDRDPDKFVLFESTRATLRQEEAMSRALARK